MRTTARTLVVAALPALVACGGFTDGGSGSRTLDVEARAGYTAGNGSMSVRVDVDQHGAHVAGAIVTVRDDDTNAVFTADEDSNSYRANIPGGYRRKLELNISSATGSDNLKAKLEGPGAHFISSPFEDATVKLGNDPLTVEWAVSDGLQADDVAVSVDGSDYRGESNRDRGDVEIPRELLRTGDDTIRVERSNTVDLDGATPGSSFRVSYEAASHVHFTD